MLKDRIIPLPPGFEIRGKEAVGLIRCEAWPECQEFRVVRLDKRGFPYASCDHSISNRGCTRQSSLKKHDIPERTPETLADVMETEGQHLNRDAREFLETAWNIDAKESDRKTARPAAEKSPAGPIPGSREKSPSTSKPEQRADHDRTAKPSAGAKPGNGNLERSAFDELYGEYLRD